jgi:multimeric flavodoxin WrbA
MSHQGYVHSVDGHLLVVWQPDLPSIDLLRDAVLAGCGDAATSREVRSLSAPATGVDDVEGAAGLVLITPERFGMVAGLVKDLLERIYPWFEEVPDRRPGLPYALIAKGGNDGTGAVRDVTRVLTGLRWREVMPPLVVAGPIQPAHLAAARELGGTVAAGLDARVF